MAGLTETETRKFAPPRGGDAAGRLLRQTRELRKRWLSIGGVSGFVWGLVVAAALAIGAMWLDLLWELPPGVRIFASRLTLVGMVVPVGMALWLVFRHASPARIARRLDRAVGSGGQIVSGFDLARSGEEVVPVRRGLSQLAVRKAALLAATAAPWAVVPLRPLRRPAIVLAVVAAAIVILEMAAPKLVWTQWQRFRSPLANVPPYSGVDFAVDPGDVSVIYGQMLDISVIASGRAVDGVELFVKFAGETQEDRLPMFQQPGGRWRTALAAVTADATYYVRADRARSPKFQIQVITVPRIERLRVRISPPAYTRLHPYEGPVPDGGIAGLAGTRVQVWVESNRPLSDGRMTVQTDTTEKAESIDLKPAVPGEKVVTGSLVVRASGRFGIRVSDVDGQSSLDDVRGAITLLEDQRPFVRMLAPRAQSYATPDVALPVQLVAEDDYGISGLSLYRSLNRSRALPQSIPVAEAFKRLDQQVSLPLSSYGLSPGDEVHLYARVEDNDPDGAKGSESPVAVVRIISQEEFQRMLRVQQGLQVLMSKYRQAERRLANLRKQNEGLKKKLDSATEESAEELRREAKDLADSLDREAAELRKFAEQSLPYDVDEEFSERLNNMARRLERRAEEIRDQAERDKLVPADLAEALARLQSDLQDEQKQYGDEVMEPLEYLEQVYPLIEDQARFVVLVARQRSLADRAASLKGRDAEDDPALKRRMRDLQEEQEKVRADLAELLDDVEDHVQKLPEDEALDELRKTAAEFVREVRRSGASEAMAEGELALDEFSGTRAAEKTTEAAEILEKFLSRCSGMAGMAGKQCKLKFGPSADGNDGLGNTIAQLLAETGMMPGSGMSGMGAGQGGYSARRSSLNNVGLYGTSPLAGGPPRSGTGEGAAGGGGSGEGPASASSATDVDQASQTHASGGSAADIPIRYRRRVGEYLRTIAEELDQAP